MEPGTDQPDMTKEQYKKNMSEVGEASLGLEMTNHVQSCPGCTNILMDANSKVIAHMREVNKLC